ncbi:MAG: outer membrane beta-barrel protein [Amphiplicatus sp.]
MRMIIAAASAAALLSAPAHADESYAKLFGGVGFGVDHDFEGEVLDSPVGSGELDTELGYDVGGALGYRFADFFSVEGEIAYRSNDIDGGVIAGAPFSADGDLNALSFMANGVFSAPGRYGFTPYVGAGAGAARIGGDGDHEVVFAYQAFGGVKRQLTDRVAAGVEYRYFGAEDATFSNPLGSVTTDYSGHNVNFVLTRSF